MVPALVVVASCAVLLAGATRAPSYRDEAAEVGKMMEAVRRQTEGGAMAATAAAAPVAAERRRGEQFPDLDAELLGRADEIGRKLREGATEAAAPHPAKRTALAAAARESEGSRAARFFAVHGMTQIGHLLGEELSASEAEQARQAAAAAQQALASAATGSGAGVHRAAAAAAPRVGGIADLDAEFEEEEDESAAKQNWKAVDRLRHRMRPM
mmetsp:Transcript_112559/g.313121  ORF Transcript_112559/g.313121 Transcript_112559/m.313121 type:complete len:212 (+) Transcript_112559:97-732(+)